MKLYVSGPMTNIPEFNFPTFDKVTALLRILGHEVVSPAEHDRELYPVGPDIPGYCDGDVPAWSAAVGFDYQTALAWDLEQVVQADGIVMLPGWENSTGAKAERFAAEATGKQVFLAKTERLDDCCSSFELDPVQRQLTAVVASDEVRVVDPTTGGAKNAKAIEYGRLPDSLEEVAKHFHDGAAKYPDVAPGVANWSLGYPWSLSIEALNRHLKAWERGEDVITDDDPTKGNSHLAAVVFHALVLMWYQKHGIGTDDRRTLAARERYLTSREQG